MKRCFVHYFILFPLFFAYAMGGIDPSEGAKAAEDFEDIVFSSVPKSKQYISYFDVDMSDGHLMVYVKASMLFVDKKKQNEVYRAYLNLWRQTKYVKQKGYGRWIEVLYFDESTAEDRTIKIVK